MLQETNETKEDNKFGMIFCNFHEAIEVSYEVWMFGDSSLDL
jgi:hypothetical protein